MTLGSTQPLTEMSTRSISWVKGGRCVRLTTYYHPVPLSRNQGTLTSWNPLGLSRPVMGLPYLYLYLRCLQTSGIALNKVRTWHPTILNSSLTAEQTSVPAGRISF